VQFLIGGIGVIGILRSRRLARRRLAEEGVVIRPLRVVIAERQWFSPERTGKGRELHTQAKVPVRRT
jgi:hypothetical protein